MNGHHILGWKLSGTVLWKSSVSVTDCSWNKIHNDSLWEIRESKEANNTHTNLNKIFTTHTADKSLFQKKIFTCIEDLWKQFLSEFKVYKLEKFKLDLIPEHLSHPSHFRSMSDFLFQGQTVWRFRKLSSI